MDSSTLRVTSNEGKFRDHSPKMTPAGKVLGEQGDSTGACMRQWEANRSTTPPHVQPYRKSYTHEPGKRHIHPGHAKDAAPPDMRFGMANPTTDTAETLIHPTQNSAWTDAQREFAESHYHTAKMEPLGKSRSHGHALPPEAKEAGYKFGCSSKFSENAKHLIYPVADEEVIEERTQNSRQVTDNVKAKSHRHYDAGEQRKRFYDWNSHGVDPESFRFGKREKDGGEGGVAAALKISDEETARTTVIPKVVEDFRDRMTDELGRPKKQWGITSHLSEEHVYGKANKMKDEWGARECLRGDPHEEEHDDGDLGRSKSHKRTDIDNDMVFGISTIRTDRQKPKNKRVTDFQNYGDEARVGGLLFPSRFADADIHDEDFAKTISKEEMASLSDKAGFNLPPEDFETIWNLAMSYTEDGSVSVDTFRRAMDELAL